jgi:DNA-binding YbaB/EbfC family protein
MMKNFDPQALMSQAKRMKDQLARVQEDLKERMVEATAPGGLVTVVASGTQEIQAIRIKPEAVDPSDVEMLEDLVTVAVKGALEKAKKLHDEEMGKVTGGMGGLGGLGF